MDKARIFLIVQSAICIAAVLLLTGAALEIYSEGTARKAQDPTAYIYTREAAVKAAAPGAFLMLAGLCLSIAGGVLGIKDEKADRPVTDKDCMRNTVIFGTAGVYEGSGKRTFGPVKLKRIRLIVLALSVILIIAGIVNGNMHAILVKAANICTECIGLG